MIDAYRLFKAAAREYSEVGVTTAQSGGVTPELARGLSIFSKLGVIRQRLVLFPFESDFGDALLNGEYDPTRYSSDMVVMGPVKLVADGSIQGFTGYLSRPYHTPYHGDKDYRGYPSIPRDKLFQQVDALHRAGYQLAIHGNGDAAIDNILEACEAVREAGVDMKTVRIRIEHCSILHDETDEVRTVARRNPGREQPAVHRRFGG